MPSSRVAAIGTEANASLISHRSTSAIFQAGPVQRPRDGDRRRQPGVGRRHPAVAHARMTASGSSPRACGERAAGHHERGGAVVDAGRVAGGDGESLDLRVQRLQRCQLLQRRCRGGGARRWRTSTKSPSRRGHLEREDLRREASRCRFRRPPACASGTPRRPCPRGVDARPRGGVPADGDRHVPDRRVGRLAVARAPASPLPRCRSRGTRRAVFGIVELDCTPPATMTWSIPRSIDAAALCTRGQPEAQCRLWATPGAFTRPASMAA